MLRILSACALVLTVTACANQNISKDMLNKDLLDDAQTVYQSCLEDYKKTMSDDDAKKVCTEKLETSYEKATEG